MADDVERAAPAGPTRGQLEPDIKAKVSVLEVYSSLVGTFQVLAICERMVSDGSLSKDSYTELVARMLSAGDGWVANNINVFLNNIGDLEKVLPGVAKYDRKATTDMLLQKVSTGERVFSDLDVRFIAAYEEKIWLGWGWKFVNDFLADRGRGGLFVQEFLKKTTFSAPEIQAQEILYKLQERLVVRRQAVERLDYDRVEKIDTNCKHFFSLLEQYGIKASTYDQALEAYERRWGRQVQDDPPQTLIEKIRGDIESRIGNLVRLQESCEAAVEANPKWERFIRWEYQKEIDKLNRGRR